MSIDSKVDICNLTLGHLGNYGTVSNIDTPTNDKETTFALWYDISRQVVLKLLMPNFALARIIVSQLVETPPFGWAYYYEYPNQCLKALGVGDVDWKQNNYAVEGNKLLTNCNYPTGLPLRYILDVTDVTQFSPEFKMLLSWELAGNTALAITQDAAKAKEIQDSLPSRYSILSGMNAQENVPIRINNSRFKAARRAGVDVPEFTTKK